MLVKNRLTMAVSAALGMSAAAVLPSVANAQDELMVEEVVVTGSRIQKANLVSTSPVTQIDAEAFKFQGTTRVEDLIADLPAVYPGNSSGDANGATGTATIDLRNLGDNRTLVLMNGRRLPPGSPQGGGQGADINQIPGALIERVEVLTGGASSTYGSDAVAGVVNFIMIDDFEGVKLDVQYSGYQHDNDNSFAQGLNEDRGFDYPSGSVTDGEISDISFVIGANLDGGRGNVTAYASYRNINALRQSERDYSNCALGGDGPADASCGGSSTVPWGRFTDFGILDDGFDFSVGGNGSEFVPFDTLYNYAPGNFFQRPDERYTGGAFGRYTINEHVEVYSEVTFMDDRSNAQIAPSGAFFVTSSLSCGNPFLSDQQFDAICGSYGLTEDDRQTVFIGRRNVEGGFRNDDLRHTNFRGVFGARGDINDVWRYDIYGQYAETSYEQTYNNDLSSTRVARALDATVDADGNTVCQSVIDGSDPTCVPWNVFQEGAVTDEMLNYLYLPLYARGTVDQKVISGYVAGDLGNYGIQLPSADTGLNLVVGSEYRSENLDYNPDSGFQSGDGAGQGGPILAVKGGYDVTEFFAELNIPIVENAAFAKELSLDLGYRYSDYSTDITTDTYKVAGAWAPTDSLKMRASFNRAVRHANIRELFRPQSLGLFDMSEDPCAGANPTATFEQCARTGVTQAQYGSIADSPAGQYNEITGGNPELAPEESDTYSVGIIYSPEFVEDLTVTVDYFDIEITGAISSISSGTILNNCLETGDALYCDAVNRGEQTGTLWIGTDNVSSIDENIGFYSTKGFDIQVDYTLGLGDMGSLAFNNVGTYLTEWDQQEFAGEAVEDCLGIWNSTSCGQPIFEFQNNLRATWMTPWQMSLSAQWRYVDSIEDGDGGNWDFDDMNYFDLSAIWDVTDMMSLRAGVQNVTDEEPPIGPAPGPSVRGNGNTFPGTYDALGRYWFVGATVQF
ncbi:TonB-dependent receptor [Parahaliea maris]|uniref:TonB-dependent receptor n=1 Tax=Parahaliea maris TaxID=2716870 RepID=A0A5C8ZQG9_9GAMM|nr:TonB-dependent receptor [Parahaliea maris]TXS90688.1 TonB-dependent receptor [Parahaliea maris]